MITWWADLSSRERLLLGVLGGLAILLLVSMAVIRPLGAWQRDAARGAEQARDNYLLVASAAAVGAQPVQGAPQGQTPLRQAITTSALSSQIELVRIGAEQNGQIEVQPAPVSGDLLFAWLSDLQLRYGVTVAFADMARAEEGAVNAQVLVLERPQ